MRLLSLTQTLAVATEGTNPRTAHTRRKTNTLCSVYGLSHVLTRLWAFMSSRECPGWNPHHPAGWLTALKQEETPAMTHDAHSDSREEPGVSYIISSSGSDVHEQEAHL